MAHPRFNSDCVAAGLVTSTDCAGYREPSGWYTEAEWAGIALKDTFLPSCTGLHAYPEHVNIYFPWQLPVHRTAVQHTINLSSLATCISTNWTGEMPAIYKTWCPIISARKHMRFWSSQACFSPVSAFSNLHRKYNFNNNWPNINENICPVQSSGDYSLYSWYVSC